MDSSPRTLAPHPAFNDTHPHAGKILFFFLCFFLVIPWPGIIEEHSGLRAAFNNQVDSEVFSRMLLLRSSLKKSNSDIDFTLRRVFGKLSCNDYFL